MGAPRITDPAKSLERIAFRLQEEYEMRDHYEAKGWPEMVKLADRRIRGLKSAHTRIVRWYL